MPKSPLYIDIDHSLSSLKVYMESMPVGEPFFILTDSNTHQHCLPVIKALSIACERAVIIQIPAGEASKSPHFLFYILEQLTHHKASRNSTLLNLGGGMVCDIGGFAASIYKRGIRCIHIPTSLLAQSDASVGSKNGIDFMGYKNIIGTFYTPEKVFISKKFLDTLPNHEMRNGIAEAFKHGLIADKNYWDSIKNDPLNNVGLLVERSISIKNDFITQDPFEKNIRKKLNAGHTIGHALEAWKLDSGTPVAHGEAVAAGLIMESYISRQSGYLPDAEFREIEKTILSLFGKIDITGYKEEDMIQRMRQDKKNSTDKISFSLIREIGNASIDDFCDEDIIRKAFTYYTGK